MDNYFAVYNTTELKGTTFRERTLDFKDLDISNAEFEIECVSDSKRSVMYLPSFVRGSVLTIPFTPLEQESGNWKVKVFMTKDSVRDIVVLINLYITTRASDNSRVRTSFDCKPFIVEISQSTVLKVVDFESLTNEQREMLRGPQGPPGSIFEDIEEVTSIDPDDFIFIEVGNENKKIRKKNLFSITPEPTTYTLTVNPTPADAVVRINGQIVSSVTVNDGTSVTIEVSKPGYITHTENVTVSSDTIRNITLEQSIQDYTLTISPTPADAVVTLNGQVTNSITVPQGTDVTINVAKTGYVTHNSSMIVNATQTVPITLQVVPVQYTLTVTADPSDSTILLNGQATNTLTVNSGTVINMVVSKEGYITQSEAITMNSNETRNITLVQDLTPSFQYYWGEIGNVFAANPSGISEANWDTQIKPNGTNGGMSYFPNASSFPADMHKTATGLNYQWWIVLVPADQSATVADLANYSWFIWDELLQAWVDYPSGGIQNQGSVTLDGVTWEYTAVRPTTITKVKFSKTQISGQP